MSVLVFALLTPAGRNCALMRASLGRFTMGIWGLWNEVEESKKPEAWNPFGFIVQRRLGSMKLPCSSL